MPFYNYECCKCGAHDQRLGGLDDCLARCVNCGDFMFRLDDPFEIRLWDEPPEVSYGQAHGEISRRL
jgi:hypothetical protein